MSCGTECAIQWANVVALFEAEYLRAFTSTNKKAHFDCLPSQYKIVDGAKKKWCLLQLLDAMLYILQHPNLKGSIRRDFNQQRVLLDCVLQELRDANPSLYRRLQLEPRLLESRAVVINLLPLTAPWSSLQNLRDFILYSAKSNSRSKSKHIKVVDLFVNHEVFIDFNQDMRAVILASLERMLSNVEAMKILRARSHLAPCSVFRGVSSSSDITELAAVTPPSADSSSASLALSAQCSSERDHAISGVTPRLESGTTEFDDNEACMDELFDSLFDDEVGLSIPVSVSNDSYLQPYHAEMTAHAFTPYRPNPAMGVVVPSRAQSMLSAASLDYFDHWLPTVAEEPAKKPRIQTHFESHDMMTDRFHREHCVSPDSPMLFYAQDRNSESFDPTEIMDQWKSESEPYCECSMQISPLKEDALLANVHGFYSPPLNHAMNAAHHEPTGTDRHSTAPGPLPPFSPYQGTRFTKPITALPFRNVATAPNPRTFPSFAHWM